MKEEDQVVDSAETTTEELEDNSQENYEESNSTGEDEAEAQAQSGEQHSDSETPEQRKGKLKRTIERAAKKEGVSVEEYLSIQSKKGGEEGSQEGSQESPKEKEVNYRRLDLKIDGLTSKKEQDIVMDYADFKGIEDSEALKTPAIKAELAEMRKKSSVPKPSKRTGTGASDSFEYWVAQAKKGNFPIDNPDMMNKLKKARIFTT